MLWKKKGQNSRANVTKYIRYGWWQSKERKWLDFTGKMILQHPNLKEIKELAMQIAGNKSFQAVGEASEKTCKVGKCLGSLRSSKTPLRPGAE